MDPLKTLLDQVGKLSDVWVPFVLALAVLAIFIWRAMEWRYGGKIEHLADEAGSLRRKLEHAEPPAAAAAELIKQSRLAEKEARIGRETPKERVFVSDNVTPRYLTDFWREQTKLEAARATDHFKGKWINVAGTVQDVERRSEFFYVTVTHTQPISETATAHDQILLVFRSGYDRLELLQRGSVIAAAGWIQEIDKRGLTLEDWELV